MPKPKKRDWSEWKEQVTGMHRLGSNYNQRHLGSQDYYEQTQTSITMTRELYHQKEDEPSIKIWVIVFLCALLARKCYFEFTKYNRIKAEAAPISRQK